jgi:putative methyltransferase (TIGR04325 family)
MPGTNFDQNRQAVSPRTSNLWEGIHPSFQDVPGAGAGFDSEIWIQKTRDYTERVLAASRNDGAIPKDVAGEYLLLPLLVSLVGKALGEKVRILDFGGGMGVSFVHLTSCLVDGQSVDYHVIEREGICEGGAQLFEHDERIHFSAQLPPSLPELDIVYLSSALQYVEDYGTLLKTLAGYEAKHFFLGKLSAGDIPTYATAQMNVPGSVIPYWFINVTEVIEILASCNYSLIYKSTLEQEYDQSNFPEEYRIGRTCNLLFSRDGSEA